MEPDLFIILSLFLGIILGGIAIWFISSYRYAAHFQSQFDARVGEHFVAKDLHKSLQSQLAQIQVEFREKEKTINELGNALSAKETHNAFLHEKLIHQKEELEKINERLKSEFENMASKILKRSTEEFAQNNQKQIGVILDPLREKLAGFEKKVNDVYIKEATGRSELKGEIRQLMALNQQISQEAKNLASALKGDTKKQGNWGEIVLERVLERSGLEKGREYFTQVSDVNAEDQRIQPDLIIMLPDNKHIIIDSKVSLSAYERFVNAEEADERDDALSAHMRSIKQHIHSLAEKQYITSRKLDTPDFVLMFLPIESSFSAAVQRDADIFQHAWDRKIVIVSPSTLLATLRTIASIWKQEKQTKNALEIARQAGALYDKFVGFLEDMNKIQKNLHVTQKSFDLAMNKLSHGSGNLIRKTEQIKQLGAKTVKSIPKEMQEGLQLETDNSDSDLNA